MPPIDPKQHTAEHILTGVFGLLFNGKILDTRFKGTKIRCDYEIKSDLPLEEIVTPYVEVHVSNTHEIGEVKIRTFQWVTPGIIRLTFVVI